MVVVKTLVVELTWWCSTIKIAPTASHLSKVVLFGEWVTIPHFIATLMLQELHCSQVFFPCFCYVLLPQNAIIQNLYTMDDW
mmetsp:Transcript_36074/g.52833  ORF Transcript_36074/g.52833 Transcript_36074/m.52833 type:complete len:82 (+) Transcript_36074:91-336(+)